MNVATYVALLRAVNVGGTGKLSMADFRAVMKKLGYENIETYIQSGNAVFDAKKPAAAVARELAAALEKHTGAPVGVILRTHEELSRVINLGCDAYGVNNRDLKTFNVSLETSLALVDRLPANAVKIAESGIHTSEHLETLRRAGFDAFLIGESLMRHADPGAALKNLLAGVSSATSIAATSQV